MSTFVGRGRRARPIRHPSIHSTTGEGLANKREASSGRGNARATSTGTREGKIWSRGILSMRFDAHGASWVRRGDGAGGMGDASEGSA
jgi:hypothetical protein